MTIAAPRCFALVATTLIACGNDPTSNVVGEISWAFDYSNWTLNDSPAAPRGCDNEPTTGDGGYSDLEEIVLEVTDPTGQRPGTMMSFPCDSGPVPLRGFSRTVFNISLSARSAAGVELYRFEDLGVDFATDYTGERTLVAVVGEVSFRPQVEGGQSCTGAVDRFRVAVTAEDESSPALELTQPACSGSFFDAIDVREIPVAPEPGSGGFVLPRFSFAVEALDGSGVTVACGTFEQAVAPGDAGISAGDPNLTASACGS